MNKRKSCLGSAEKLAAPQPEAQPQWLPIETAPKDSREMFVVRAFNVDPIGIGKGFSYTSDAYAVFRADDGAFVRWPHTWPPTHWMPLPAAPSAQAEQGGK